MRHKPSIYRASKYGQLLLIGQQMSNWLFNTSQGALPPELRESAKEMVAQWDAEIRKQAAGGAHPGKEPSK